MILSWWFKKARSEKNKKVRRNIGKGMVKIMWHFRLKSLSDPPEVGENLPTWGRMDQTNKRLEARNSRVVAGLAPEARVPSLFLLPRQEFLPVHSWVLAEQKWPSAVITAMPEALQQIPGSPLDPQVHNWLSNGHHLTISTGKISTAAQKHLWRTGFRLPGKDVF